MTKQQEHEPLRVAGICGSIRTKKPHGYGVGSRAKGLWRGVEKRVGPDGFEEFEGKMLGRAFTL